MTWATVEADLRAVAATVAVAPDVGSVALRWGPLFALLDRRDDLEFAGAVELIYEGYLVHYRTARVAAVDPGDRQAALLAGDVFYARGLRTIAARGDVDAVALLARLMGTCSYLRSLDAAFVEDDALWAYTMGALAAVRAGVPAEHASRFFDELETRLAEGAPPDVAARARVAARALGLSDAAPLEEAYDLLRPPTHAAGE